MAKKAIIQTGGKQYLVTEGETLNIELLKSTSKTVDLEALLLIDGDKISVGSPIVDKVKVTADIIENDIQADKVTSVRYKAKKRVHKVRGHRQHHSVIKIAKIA